MRWFETPDFNFVNTRKIAYIFSGILIIASVGAMIFKGLQFGIDFKGGQEYVYQFEEPVEITEVRSLLSNSLGTVPEIKNFGSDREILIRIESGVADAGTRQVIQAAFEENLAENPYTFLKDDQIGARFADDLKYGALQAIIYAIFIIFIYILIRFRDWRFSAGAVAALIHDVTITLGIFTLLSDVVDFNLQIDQAIIAAFLTIVGYSLNDTVVVFDRIRENSTIFKGMHFPEMVNKSLNHTLSRTVITSVTTLFVVLVLFIFGGEVLKGFSFALIIGVILGTYSSLYVASALVVELEGQRKS